MSARVLALFAKAPRPGSVKTRLVPPLSGAQAADLYAAMLDDVARAPRPEGCDRALWFTPPETRAWFEARYGETWELHVQRGATLGARMAQLFRVHTSAGARRVVLRGTDSPTLPAERVVEAFEALERSDLVLCPDRDGGYNLIGLREPCDALFDHEMSTASVLEQTVARARSLGLELRVLAAHHDVDTAEDLVGLRRELRSAAVRRLAPATWAWLEGAQSLGIAP